jgi:hypothetical protein
MSKVFVYSLIVIGLSATATVSVKANSGAHNMQTESRLATEGAFRDGLFLGKLNAENGQRMRPPVGRWSTQQDRAMFLAGYQRGYAGGR